MVAFIFFTILFSPFIMFFHTIHYLMRYELPKDLHWGLIVCLYILSLPFYIIRAWCASSISFVDVLCRNIANLTTDSPWSIFTVYYHKRPWHYDNESRIEAAARKEYHNSIQYQHEVN